MTNDQIREIVGTEPQPWWPKGIRFRDYKHGPSFWMVDVEGVYHDEADEEGEEWRRSTQPLDDRMESVASLIDSDHAEAMFIGAAVAWLLSRDASVVRLPNDMYGVRIPALFAVGQRAQEGSRWCKSDNLLAVLVAACKELK